MNLYKLVRNTKVNKKKMPNASNNCGMEKGLQLKNISRELVKNELALLHRKNQGELMDSIDSIQYIVLQSSRTRCDQSYSVEQMMRDHIASGLRTIGYHFYIQRDGTMTQHRRLLEVGEHAQLYNHCSIGICYEGGLDTDGKPTYILTDAQYTKLAELLQALHELFPEAKVIGHHVFRDSISKGENYLTTN